jgi:hypothetical protein
LSKKLIPSKVFFQHLVVRDSDGRSSSSSSSSEMVIPESPRRPAVHHRRLSVGNV